MARIDAATEDLAVACRCSWRLAAEASHGPGQKCECLRLLSAADPLTRLMMQADGVSEFYMGELLQKVATALAKR